MKAVTKYAHDTATLLRSLGVNWNYAPDADYSDNPKVIYLSTWFWWRNGQAKLSR